MHWAGFLRKECLRFGNLDAVYEQRPFEEGITVMIFAHNGWLLPTGERDSFAKRRELDGVTRVVFSYATFWEREGSFRRT